MTIKIESASCAPDIEHVELLPSDPYNPYCIPLYQKITAFRNQAHHPGTIFVKRSIAEAGYAFIAIATLVECVVRLALSAITYLFSWLAMEFGERKHLYIMHKRLLAGTSVNGILFPITLSSLVTNLFEAKL